MDYSVTGYKVEHRRKVAELHALLINASPRLSRRYLRWSYEENPFLSTPIMAIVWLGDTVVGMRGAFGTCWNWGPGTEEVVLPHTDDLIIHPDHRNRGLFLLIHRALVDQATERGFPALLGLSGREMTQKLALLTGWKEVGDLTRTYRSPLGGESSALSTTARVSRQWRGQYRLRELARRMGYSPSMPPPDRAVDRILASLPVSKNEHIQASREGDFEGMSSLWASAAPTGARAVRPEAYFRWRLGKPNRKYRFLYWRDSALRGYMVLAWSGRITERVMIADHAAEDETVFEEMLHVITEPGRLEIGMMHSTIPESFSRVATAMGFVPDADYQKDQRRRILYYPLKPDTVSRALEQASESYPEGWRVSLLDTMAP